MPKFMPAITIDVVVYGENVHNNAYGSRKKLDGGQATSLFIRKGSHCHSPLLSYIVVRW